MMSMNEMRPAAAAKRTGKPGSAKLVREQSHEEGDVVSGSGLPAAGGTLKKQVRRQDAEKAAPKRKLQPESPVADEVGEASFADSDRCESVEMQQAHSGESEENQEEESVRSTGGNNGCGAFGTEVTEDDWDNNSNNRWEDRSDDESEDGHYYVG